MVVKQILDGKKNVLCGHLLGFDLIQEMSKLEREHCKTIPCSISWKAQSLCCCPMQMIGCFRFAITTEILFGERQKQFKTIWAVKRRVSCVHWGHKVPIVFPKCNGEKGTFFIHFLTVFQLFCSHRFISTFWANVAVPMKLGFVSAPPTQFIH